MKQLDIILHALKIDGKCVGYNEHRHMAFYDVELRPGTPINRLERRTREIALSLRSKTVPIVKLLPKQGVVRLQVANTDADILPIEKLFENVSMPSENICILPFVLGETDEGFQLWVDLAKHPHTLVAGGTGSGKSVLLHNFIANVVYLNKVKARDVQLFLIDPKRVEFIAYEAPAMSEIVHKVVYDYESAILLLQMIEQTMEARYTAMANFGFSSVEEQPGIFPYYVIIIDEVADLMIQDKRLKMFESLVVRLAQKCRAAGIYLILATQRPSTDILTGLIKANFPARISCKVASRVDSQVILDSPGAENLLGRGDALLQSPIYDRKRFQVAYANAKNIVMGAL